MTASGVAEMPAPHQDRGSFSPERTHTSSDRLPMRTSLPALLLFAACGLGAAETVPPAPPAPAGGPAAGDNGMSDRRLQRLIEENPELKGVDPKTPEGQEKIQQAMQKGMARGAEQMRKRMAENQTENHAKLRESFAMSAEEFSAIEPLLVRVESLRMQERVVNPQGMMGGGRGRGPGGQGGPGGGAPDFAKMLLGDTPLEPSTKEVQDATKALSSLLADAQANATEVAAALVRVRAARAALTAVVAKAQEDLRGVLTPRQEAVLVERGTLD